MLRIAKTVPKSPRFSYCLAYRRPLIQRFPYIQTIRYFSVIPPKNDYQHHEVKIPAEPEKDKGWNPRLITGLDKRLHEEAKKLITSVQLDADEINRKKQEMDIHHKRVLGSFWKRSWAFNPLYTSQTNLKILFKILPQNLSIIILLL
eukprot:TRINITY_DN1733_c0_g1_i1.p1 TRINITY_DN1733_c0_g1~~TRINITY_DN1733_c0_g1_i1.p1  ORF type:complete len:147 (-),score=15.12 TRINITY_DN1733_c0_g1_i1:570-1010(-)